jgi:SNF2 family DNA or RNA helicase
MQPFNARATAQVPRRETCRPRRSPCGVAGPAAETAWKGWQAARGRTVILYDPWWNPAVEAQAIDRSHRIGQDKPLFVHRLVTLGTIEEKMLDLQRRKGALAAGLLEPEAGGALDITADDIERLLAEG